jgi:FecR protein
MTSPRDSFPDELARALPEPTLRPGAKQRVRAALEQRIEAGRHWTMTQRHFLAAAAAALVVAGMSYLRFRSGGIEREHHAVAGSEIVSSILSLSSGTRVLVRPGSEVSVVRDDDGETNLLLRSGGLVAHVQKRTSGSFVVQAGDVSVRVVGTIFAVERHGASDASVRVVEGRVEVGSHGKSTMLGSSDAWPSEVPAPAVSEMELRLLLGEEPAVPAHDGGSAGTTDGADGGTDAAFVASPTSPSSVPHPSPYALAQADERRGNLVDALVAYRRIAGSASADAEAAQFDVGRLELERHEEGAALEAFKACRQRFPKGSYARAADGQVLDILVARGDHDGTLAEATRFLVAHPTDPRAWRFRLARAAVRISRGDCFGGLADLEGVPTGEAVRALRLRCGETAQP